MKQKKKRTTYNRKRPDLRYGKRQRRTAWGGRGKHPSG